MIYKCEKCNIETTKKYDYEKHLETLKHKEKSKKYFKCDKCDAIYKSQSGIYSHRKKCHNNENNIFIESNTNDLQIKLIEAKLEAKYANKKKDLEHEKTKMKLEHEQEKVKILQEMIKNSNQTTDKALKITSKTISALKYANEHFKDAPLLTPIENYNVMNYDLNDEEDKKKLIEDILFYYRKNSLHTLFGKHIISEYKKDNINQQSMHTTDTSRLNYIIRTQDTNNLLKWAQDKNGVYVCNNLIDKLINYHVNILKWYHKILIDEMSLDPSRPHPTLQKKVENISHLLSDIESGQIIKDTNKFIAPFFNLDK